MNVFVHRGVMESQNVQDENTWTEEFTEHRDLVHTAKEFVDKVQDPVMTNTQVQI